MRKIYRRGITPGIALCQKTQFPYSDTVQIRRKRVGSGLCLYGNATVTSCVEKISEEAAEV